MSLGGGSQKVKVKRTKEEKEAQRLYVESLRLRNQFLPFLMQDFGFGTDMQGRLSRLPQTAQRQGMDDLALTSLGGAQDAARMMQGRFNLQQSMLPGLLHSVQSSMAPGSQSAGLPGLLSMGSQNQSQKGNGPPDWQTLLSALSQISQIPQAQTQAPPSPLTGPDTQYFTGVPSDDTVSETLKGLGYGKSQRQAMPLSRMLSLMGGNAETFSPLVTSKGYSMNMPLKDFFGSAFGSSKYRFTLQDILAMLQSGSGGG